MPAATTGLQVLPLENEPFGAKIVLPEGITDPSKLNDEDFALLKKALLENLVIVIPDQAELSPESQYQLTLRFDPTCKGNYGHEDKIFHHKDSVLAKDGKNIPERPEVIYVGNGSFRKEELSQSPDQVDLVLEHPQHHTFHKKLLTEEEKANNQTRFFRWHIDAALYGLAPPMVTTLLGIKVPATNIKQTIVYEDTKEVKELTKGSTAFASGAIAFNLLSEEEKQFALNTTVVYAPHPYIFINEARATSDGLTMVSEGKEIALDKLPEWEDSKIKRLPLVWTNPITKQHHLQVHGCCVWKLLNSETGEEIADLAEARKIVHGFMRRAISPEKIYCHAWEKGDLAIFFNRGVWHSVTGEFAHDEKRLMHQCNVASGEDPLLVK